jgi:hypothetical protein
MLPDSPLYAPETARSWHLNRQLPAKSAYIIGCEATGIFPFSSFSFLYQIDVFRQQATDSVPYNGINLRSCGSRAVKRAL